MRNFLKGLFSIILLYDFFSYIRKYYVKQLRQRVAVKNFTSGMANDNKQKELSLSQLSNKELRYLQKSPTPKLGVKLLFPIPPHWIEF